MGASSLDLFRRARPAGTWYEQSQAPEPEPLASRALLVDLDYRSHRNSSWVDCPSFLCLPKRMKEKRIKCNKAKFHDLLSLISVISTLILYPLMLISMEI